MNIHTQISPPDESPSLPHNIAAEHAVLGCLLNDNDAIHRVDDLRPEQFFEPTHSRIFAAISNLIAKESLASPISVLEKLKNDPGLIELGAIQYMAFLVEEACHTPAVRTFSQIISDLSGKRELIRISEETGYSARLGESTAREQIEDAEQKLFALAETGRSQTGFISLEDTLARAVGSAARAYETDGGLSGLSTGLSDLDHRLGGMAASDLLTLAGRPSMGKTALAVNIAFNVARRYTYEALPDGRHKTASGGVVGIFSLEMSAEQLGMRLLADVSGISSSRLRQGKITPAEFGLVRDAAIEIQSAPLYIDDTGGLSIAKLSARARRMKRTTGLDLLVIDYLQLITTGNRRSDNRTVEVSEITQSLKALAKELNVPILALSQLSRNVENREDKRPQLSDLRESGSIEQDSDVVIFIFREAYYLSRSEPREGTPEHLAWQDDMARCRRQAEVIIGKQRHGPIGTVKLSFNEDLTKFGNLVKEGFSGHVPYRGAD